MVGSSTDGTLGLAAGGERTAKPSSAVAPSQSKQGKTNQSCLKGCTEILNLWLRSWFGCESSMLRTCDSITPVYANAQQ